MTQNDIINTVAISRHVAKSYISDQIGYKTRQQLSDKMTRMTLKSNELIDMLEKFDYKIVLEDLRTGEIVQIFEEKEGIGIRTMVRGKYRNTNKCIFRCRYQDGDELVEIFEDPMDGAYLMARYGDKNKLKLISDEAALELIQEHSADVSKKEN